MLSIAGERKNLASRKDYKCIEKPSTSITTSKISCCSHNIMAKNKKSIANNEYSKAPSITRKMDTNQTIVPKTKLLSIFDVATKRIQEPARCDNSCGEVYVRFNHNNKPFKIHNTVLKWEDVDEQYCLSFVYRGNFKRDLRYHKNPVDSLLCNNNESIIKLYALRDDDGLFFIDLENGDQLILELQEDPVAGIGAEGLRLCDAPLLVGTTLHSAVKPSIQQQSGKMSLFDQNQSVADITSELKALSVAELGSEHARDLIERRDLQDVLYSTY